MIETIITAVCSLLAGGGIVSIFLIREKRRAAMLENKQKEADIEDNTTERWIAYSDRLEKKVDDLERDKSELYNETQTLRMKIDALYNEKSAVQSKLDTCNTNWAVSNIFRCEIMNCEHRKPPLTKDGKLKMMSYNPLSEYGNKQQE